MPYFASSSLSIFFYSKTNVVKNLNPINSVNKSSNLFLTVNLESLSSSSRLKEFKILTMKVLTQHL